MKKSILLIAPIIGMCIGLSSCEKKDYLSFEYEQYTKEIIKDNYRNMYQIFPISFSDSDGNGKGDLQGIIDKLDYLEQMNYTGIWLNPIHPSATSHHYDVENYYDVADVFGGLEAFDSLVEELHNRDMTIIIDLVLNHSSNKNEWFLNSYYAAKAGKTTKDEYLRYNWISCSGNAPTGYHKVNSSDKVAYEGQFDSAMPDFNLQQILDDENSDLATEFKNIFKFWLIDHNVDGFRLDATTQYFTGEQDKNLEILTFINNECKKLKPDCYIVGEGSWGSNSVENKAYQASGIDSFFQFANSAKNTGYIQQAVIQQNAKTISTALTRNKENADGGIEAPFLSNHDTPRYIGSVNGRKNSDNAKFAMGLFQQLAGATFTYYGDEVGLASQSTTSDSFYRLPIRWGEEDSHNCDVAKLGLYGVSASKIDEGLSYPYPDVQTQLNDPNSLLNYVKKANLLRIQFPEIARGDSTLVYNPSSPFAVIQRTYDNSTIYAAINASINTPMEIDYKQYGENVVEELCTKNKVQRKEKDSTIIVIPPQGIAIIK